MNSLLAAIEFELKTGLDDIHDECVVSELRKRLQAALLAHKDCKHPTSGLVVVAGGMAWWCSGCGALDNDKGLPVRWQLPGEKE